ncbi:MAG TPA: adenylate/guanylate cyclase domain-containing protein [Bradyrhizobium sp.]|nr:adenylate/guanylate cyclase domain-containing protein [Bradyrhizobium sp.]
MKNVLRRSAQALASRRSVGLLLLAILLLIRVWDPRPLEELRLRSFDFFQTTSPRDSAVRPVVIVDIDESSLSAFGQWPWPRTILADLLTRLYEWQAAAIAFDVIFPEPDRSSLNEAVKHFRDLDDDTRGRLLHLPSNDEVFAQAIGRGNVVLGQAGINAFHPRSLEKPPETAFATVGPDPSPYLIAFPYILRNLPKLEQAAVGHGLISIRTERDGMVRRVPIVMQAEDKIVPALTLDLLRVATGSSTIMIRTDESGIQSVAVPGLELPTDRNGRIWVYFGPHDKARFVSAKDVVEGNVAPERFAGKLVLVGTSAIGLLDVKTTPVLSAMPGVEVHAQLLEAALTNSLLVAPSYAIVVEMIGALIGGVVLALLAPAASVLMLFASAALAAAAFVAASWILFSRYQMLFDATFPLIATLSVYMSMVLMGYFREQLDRRRIRSAFAQYLSPTLVEQLANSPQRLVLGGEERVITVLFSDVRGFTTIAETYKDNPHGLTTLMNRFLTPLTNAIMARNGTIDKYMGDAVMAFWNAPLDDPAHESDACHAALDMLERVDALNQEREREASTSGTRFVPIKIGIGINTGRCTVGNMGSDLRFQYTVMGDSVNLASRLEGQTKAYGLPILIGSRTAAAVAEQFALLEIDSIRVKGKTEAEVIYAIVGRADVAASPEFRSLQDHWAMLRVCYRKQDWTGALKMIDLCRCECERLGLVGLIDGYADRIRRLEQRSPTPEWDGVFTAETK